MQKYDYTAPPKDGREHIPPGATQQAADREAGPGGPEPTPLDDRYGAGTPGGGTEIGGLGGTNLGDGGIDEEEMAALADASAGGGQPDEDQDGGPPYSGHSGGAVGGTPAEGRSTGGHIRGGLRPEDQRIPDTTIGSDPERT